MKMAICTFAGIVGLIVTAVGMRQMVYGDAPTTAVVRQPQEAGERVSVADEGCSLRVPRGWVERKMPHGGTVFLAPKESGYLANLTVIAGPFGGSLRQYADKNIAGVMAATPSATFGSDSTFVTETGAPSFRATFANKTQDRNLMQAMYFFDGPSGRKIIITTTAHAEHSTELQSLFDSCTKSLTVLAAK